MQQGLGEIDFAILVGQSTCEEPGQQAGFGGFRRSGGRFFKEKQKKREQGKNVNSNKKRFYGKKTGNFLSKFIGLLLVGHVR